MIDNVAYSPWHDAAERHPGIHIERCDIAPIRGAWVPSERVILLDHRLDRDERRSTLAHEIGHVDLDHEPSGHAWFDARMEHDADELAAVRLIHIALLLDALRWAETMEEVAHECGVSEHLLLKRLDVMSVAERRMVADLAKEVEGGC